MLQVAKCVSCYPQQAQAALEAFGADDETCYRVMEAIFPYILSFDRSKNPAENSTLLLHRIYELLGEEDPFREARAQSNQRALRLLPELETMVREAADPLLEAVRVSIAGNIVDMGLALEYDLKASLREVEVSAFDRFDYPALKEGVNSARNVLIIGDNSGEIVFDRLLARQIARDERRVVYAVKASPILNDATWSDVEQSGMRQEAEIIDTGSNYLGVCPGHFSPSFREAMESSDLIIAKGQANFETLEGSPLAGEKTFFLLRAKCRVVAKHLRVSYMSPVLAQNRLTG